MGENVGKRNLFYHTWFVRLTVVSGGAPGRSIEGVGQPSAV
jgi:hypothetical protein